MLEAIILDDEELGRKNLLNLLADYCPEVTVVGMASSPMEALKLLHVYSPNLVFLDVHMPEGSGFDFLDGLGETSFSTVFVTAYREYGIDALKSGAIDYLMKPVDFRELQLAVNKAFQQQKIVPSPNPPSRILMHLAEGSFILKLSEVVFIQAENNYSEFFMVDGKSKIVSMTLGKVQEAYHLQDFFRINNSLIINLGHVNSYTKTGGKEVTMSSGKEFQISRRRFSDFIKALNQFIQ